MGNAYIYILTNPILQEDCLIIDITKQTPETVAKEISIRTAIPGYEVAYKIEVPDCISSEKIIHQFLNEYRLDEITSYFMIPLKKAIREVDKIGDEIDRIRTEVNEKQLGLDKVFALMKEKEYEVPEKLLGGLLGAYLGLGKEAEVDCGLLFRLSLVALVFSTRLDKNKAELKDQMANFAESNFNSVIEDSTIEERVEEIGDTSYFLPYHAYINRAIALIALERYEEAEQVCKTLRGEINNIENEGLKNKLAEQCESMFPLIDSEKFNG